MYKDQKETEIEKLQTKIDSDSARSAELKEHHFPRLTERYYCYSYYCKYYDC